MEADPIHANLDWFAREYEDMDVIPLVDALRAVLDQVPKSPDDDLYEDDWVRGFNAGHNDVVRRVRKAIAVALGVTNEQA